MSVKPPSPVTEYTPTPWRVVSGDDYYIEADGYPSEFIRRFKGDDTGHYLALVGNRPADFGEANAAFIVKAVNNFEALLEFFRWAMREGPWDGGDLDGASIQDKAEALGLIVKTQYDAERHGVQSDFEHGDDWFEYAPDLRPSPQATESTPND